VTPRAILVLLLTCLTLDLIDPGAPGVARADSASLFVARVVSRADAAPAAAPSASVAPRLGVTRLRVQPAPRAVAIERPRPVEFRSRAALAAPAPSDARSEDH
jgi:hypothetical protein